MPEAARRYCRVNGCPQFEGECETHRAKRAENRRSASARLYDWRWHKASAAFLKKHRLCVYCEAKGRTQASQCVDHRIPHRGNETLFWDRTNWVAACLACNTAKQQWE